MNLIGLRKGESGTSILEVLLVISLLSILAIAMGTIVSTTISTNMKSSQFMQQQADIESLYGYTAAKVATFEPMGLGGTQAKPINTEARTNLAPSPYPGNWHNYTETGVEVTDVGVGRGGWRPNSGNPAFFLSARNTETSPKRAEIWSGSTGTIEVQPSTEYSVSVAVRSIFAAGPYRASILWYNDSTYLSASTIWEGTIANGEDERVGGSVSSPSNANRASVSVGPAALEGGEAVRFAVSDIMFEQGSTGGNYADGNNLGWEWSGLENDSPSTTITETTNYVTNPNMANPVTNGWQAATGASISAYSGAANSRFSNNSMLIETTSSSASRAQSPVLSVTPGLTYTASVYVKAANPQSVGETFRISIREQDASGSNISSNSYSQFDLTNNWQRISVTRTFSSEGVIARVWLGNRNSTISAYVDGAMLTPGPAPVPFADPTTNPAKWTWNGAPNNSSSSSEAPTAGEMINPAAVGGDQFVAVGSWGGTTYCYRFFYVQRLRQIRVAVGEPGQACNGSNLFPKRGPNETVDGGGYKITNPSDPEFDPVLDALPDEIGGTEGSGSLFVKSTVIAENIVRSKDGSDPVPVFSYFNNLNQKVNFPVRTDSNSTSPLYEDEALLDTIGSIGMQTYTMASENGGFVSPRYFSQIFALDQPLCVN